MQHLDEGTIHAWLDGALTADEAARVEGHVKECPQCAARVAEARGLIAASSRILTALDNVPSGVLPQAARVKSRNWPVWRAAAAVAVVALGTLVVTRGTMRVADRVSVRDSVGNSVERSLPTAMPTAPAGVVASSRAAESGKTVKHPAVSAAPRASSGSPPKPRATTTSVASSAQEGNLAQPAEPRAVASAPMSVGQPHVTAQPNRVAFDGANMRASLRVVGNPSAIGEKRTLYEVAPGDTVLLTESEAVAPNAVGAVAGNRAATTVPQAQQKTTAPTLSPMRDAPSSSAFAGSNGVNTIVWTDVASGKVMKLSGHHSRAELEDIRRRIEQARTADSVRRKAP